MRRTYLEGKVLHADPLTRPREQCVDEGEDGHEGDEVSDDRRDQLHGAGGSSRRRLDHVTMRTEGEKRVKTQRPSSRYDED